MTSSSTVGGIWPWATATRTSGTCLSRKSFDLGEVLDARADVEGLAAAIALAQQRLAHDHRIERRHEGAHREPVDRRRGDDRHLAHAGQRQLQRARDRRRGQRQHMDFGAQRASASPCGATPKCCSSSTTTSPRSLNLMVLPSSAWVPTTMSIVPVGEALLDLGEFGVAGDQARGLRDVDRTAARSRLGEGLEMLARQQRRRHHHRDLLAAHAPRRRPRAAPPRSCRSRHRRRPAGPSAGRRRDRRARRRWPPAGRRSRHRGSRRRTRRRGLRRRSSRGASRSCRSAAILISSLGHLADAVLHPRLARLPGRAAEPVELDAPRLPSRSATRARCSPPAGTACRRRHNGFPGSRAARRRPRWSSGR